MATDSEKREIAERLRELDYSDLQESLICAYLDALGIKGYEDWIGIAHRLADLIEPAPKCSEATPKCDRDALLALADEIHGLVENREIRFFHTVQVHESTLATIETRIRSALGVDDND